MYETRSRHGNTTPVLNCAREHGVSYADALRYVDWVVHRRDPRRPVIDLMVTMSDQALGELLEIANDTRRAMGRAEALI